MKIGISVKIDVTKIDKERLFHGAKGTYLDLTTFIDTEALDEYGNNGFIAQSQSKEERESGAPKPPILGNCKVFYRGQGATQEDYSKGVEQAKAAMAPAGGIDLDDFTDDGIPF